MDDPKLAALAYEHPSSTALNLELLAALRPFPVIRVGRGS